MTQPSSQSAASGPSSRSPRAAGGQAASGSSPRAGSSAASSRSSRAAGRHAASDARPSAAARSRTAAPRVELWPLARILPYGGNPRRAAGAVDAVARSIAEFGFRSPIIVDRGGVIIAGHTRLAAAEKLGMKDAPVVVARDLTPAKARALRLADNRTAELSEWDLDALTAELTELRAAGDDLSALGWDEGELEELLGGLYELGEHRLLCGDAKKAEDVARLMAGEKAALIVTDPPYGIGIDEWDKEINFDGFCKMVIGFLSDKAFVVFFSQMPILSEWCETAKRHLEYFEHIVWAKRMRLPSMRGLSRTHESLLIFRKGKAEYFKTTGKFVDVSVPLLSVDAYDISSIKRYFSSLLTLAKTGEYGKIKEKTRSNPIYSRFTNLTNYDRFEEEPNFSNLWSFLPENRKHMSGEEEDNVAHSTVKPILFCNRLLELLSPIRALVLDPFGGSGTTLIACEQLGRRCRMLEIDPVYCDIIVRRWEEFTGRKAKLRRADR